MGVGVAAGSAVTYTGSVQTAAGAPAAGTVTVQKRRADGGSWSSWRTTTLTTSLQPAAARRGDLDAFVAILQDNDRQLRAIAWRLLGERSLMDDALQEVAIKAARALPELRDDAGPRPSGESTVLHTSAEGTHERRGATAAAVPAVALGCLVHEHGAAATGRGDSGWNRGRGVRARLRVRDGAVPRGSP